MSNYIYCGFWRRCGAYIIDCLFLTILGKCLDKLNLEDSLSMILTLILVVLYWSLCESSQAQATPGKTLLKIKIINSDSTSISFLKSSFRAVLLYLMIFIIGIILSILSAESSGEEEDLSMIPLLIGCLIVGIFNMFCIIFTKQKTSIPDMIFGTRVVKREDKLENLNI